MMRGWSLLLILVVISGCGFAADAGRTVFEYSARPEKSNNFAEASFSCIFPRDKPLAILFLAGGTDFDARPWLNDSRWQTFAESAHLILIASCLRGAGESYEVASGGSGQTLLEAIVAFAGQSGRSEINGLPLILYGHSAGAQFAFNFACWKPERVRAVIGVKSGPLPQPTFRKAPPFRALFIVGERDLAGRVREVARAFAAGRSVGAPWCLADQPNAGHDTQGCRELAEAFIRTVCTANTDRAGYVPLARPNQRLTTRGRTDPAYSWLPGPPFYQAWRGFVRDTSLPQLLTLPEEPPQDQFSWEAITPLPPRVAPSPTPVKFAYVVSLPSHSTAITPIGIKTSNPAIHAMILPRSAKECTVVGDCDLRGIQGGPLKCELEIEIQTPAGIRKRNTHSLFTQVAGPISASPSSLYYGVLPRETTAEFGFTLRSDATHNIRSCELTSTDPQFLHATITPSEHADGYRVNCTIHSGSRIGPKNGRLTLRIEADQEYIINVPFFGFVQK